MLLHNKRITQRNLFYPILLCAGLGINTFANSQERLTHEQIKQLPQAEAMRLYGEFPYHHPLQGVELVDGKVPLVDIKNAPDGSRYVLVDGADSTQANNQETSSSVEHEGEPNRLSQVETMQRSKITPEEYAQMRAEKTRLTGVDPATIPEPTLAPVIGPQLQEKLTTAEPNEMLTVAIALKEKRPNTLQFDLERAIGLGDIRTNNDYQAKYRVLFNERKKDIAEIQTLAAREIEALGGKILSNCSGNMYCMAAELPVNKVENIARINHIRRLNLNAKLVTHSIDQVQLPDNNLPRATIVDGVHVREGSQLDQFIDKGFNGWWGFYYYSAEPFGGVNDEHVAYKGDLGNNQNNKIKQRAHCDTNYCYDLYDFFTNNEFKHHTETSGLAIGDLTLGQDSNIISDYEQKRRSGYAGQARAIIHRADNNAAGQNSMAYIFDSNLMHNGLQNASWDIDVLEGACDGQDSNSLAVNELFENGWLTISGAGNKGHALNNDCTVGSPGVAISAFTVGSHGNSGYGDSDDVRSDDIYSLSSRGGISGYNSEGKGRSIIDITAFGYRTLFLDNDDNDGYLNNISAGTSFSAPTVSAAAIDFQDFYRTEISNFINTPGVLFTSMLLMGDRQGQFGNADKMKAYYNNLWGAGRLKMRKFNAHGMDTPWQHRMVSTCIDHGEKYTYKINNGHTIPNDADSFKAVMFWYDRSHGDDEYVDDIDLNLRRTDIPYILYSSVSSQDNKERIYYHDVGNMKLELEISGYKVTSDDQGCGTNSMRVYFSFFYEDSDRDDSNGPYLSEVERES